MKITQTRFFKEDADHYTRLALSWMYTTKAEETRAALYRLDRLRGKEYSDTLAAKCNQKLKARFYYRTA